VRHELKENDIAASREREVLGPALLVYPGTMRCVVLALFLATMGASVAARAQVDEGVRASARQLADEAGEAFEKGDFAAALDKYRRADALVPLPTLSLRVARCLEKLGRYVEASERYLEVARIQVEQDPRGLQAEAKTQAEAERAALLPRIPALILELRGDAAGATVTLDDKPFPTALLGAKRLLDPGTHRVVVRVGSATATREVRLTQGETMTVPIDLAKGPAEARTPTPGPTAPAPEQPPTPPPPPTSNTRPLRGAAITFGVIGAAGLVVGGVTGGLALGQKGALANDCVPKGGGRFDCSPAGKNAADTAQTLGVASTAAVVAGLASGGLAIGLGVAAARATPTDRTSLPGRITMTFASTGNAVSVAATATDLYWTDNGNGTAPGSVLSLAIANTMGAPTKIAPITTMGSFGQAYAATAFGSSLFFYTSGIPGIYEVPLQGTSGETRLAKGSAPTAVAADASFAYWGEQTGNVMAVTTGASPSATTLVSGTGTVATLAVDASGIYWGVTTGHIKGGQIMKAALDGSDAHLLAVNVSFPNTLVLDATNVYFVDSATIYTLPK
jgi:hypothetical protein